MLSSVSKFDRKRDTPQLATEFNHMNVRCLCPKASEAESTFSSDRNMLGVYFTTTWTSFKTTMVRVRIRFMHVEGWQTARRTQGTPELFLNALRIVPECSLEFPWISRWFPWISCGVPGIPRNSRVSWPAVPSVNWPLDFLEMSIGCPLMSFELLKISAGFQCLLTSFGFPLIILKFPWDSLWAVRCTLDFHWCP